MTSPNYRYYQISNFDGGIQTQPERAKPNQLLDALNVWTPRSALECRPATSCIRFTNGLVSSTGQAATTTILSPYSGGADSLLTLGSSLSGVQFGDEITFHFTTLTTPERLVWLEQFWQGTNSTVSSFVPEMYTSRGWIGFFATPLTFVQGNGTPLVGGVPIFIVSPADPVTTTLTFTTGSYSGYFIRLRIIGGTFGTSAISAAVTYGNGVVWDVRRNSSQLSSPANPAFLPAVIGAYRLQTAASTRVISLTQTGATTPLLSGGEAAIGFRRNYKLSIEGARFFPRFGSKYRIKSIPPSIAVIPEFNISYMAYANDVYQIDNLVPVAGVLNTTSYADPVDPLISYLGPETAQVNTDPNVIGPLATYPLATYSTDIYGLSDSFPAANLIVYFKSRLWAAGIQGLPNVIRWSGVAGERGYNVWPIDSQTYLSTADDNSEITAIAPMGDNLAVFKKNSIWLMIDAGDADNGLGLYEARQVVTGVGCLAHASVCAVNGGLMFLAEDGFYFFDGTPDIQRISDPLFEYVGRINPARAPFAQAVNWRTKHMYLCAVSLDSESNFNNYIFAYDYEAESWWVWSGLDTQCFYQEDGVGLKEEVYSLDRYGRAYKFLNGMGQDNGAPTETMVLTQRFGEREILTKDIRELRIRGQNNNGPITFDAISDDIPVQTGMLVTMPLTDEAQYDSVPAPQYNVAQYAPDRRRARRHAFRTTSQWIQVKVYNALKILGLDIGFNPDSNR